MKVYANADIQAIVLTNSASGYNYDIGFANMAQGSLPRLEVKDIITLTRPLETNSSMDKITAACLPFGEVTVNIHENNNLGDHKDSIRLLGLRPTVYLANRLTENDDWLEILPHATYNIISIKGAEYVLGQYYLLIGGTNSGRRGGNIPTESSGRYPRPLTITLTYNSLNLFPNGIKAGIKYQKS